MAIIKKKIDSLNFEDWNTEIPRSLLPDDGPEQINSKNSKEQYQSLSGRHYCKALKGFQKICN